MFRLMLSVFGNEIRSKKSECMSVIMWLGIYIVLFSSYSYGSQVTEVETQFPIAGTVITLMMLLLIYTVFKAFPLRVSKGLFLCAAGKKERILFLRMQMWCKVSLAFFSICVVNAIVVGTIFLHSQVEIRLAQLVLQFFTIYVFSLRIGIGERGNRKINSEGYAIYSDAEVMVNQYWLGLIIAQQALFYMVLAISKESASWMGVAMLISFVLLNGYLAMKYTHRIFEEGLKYENVYNQEPIVPVEQVDYYDNWGK